MLPWMFFGGVSVSAQPAHIPEPAVLLNIHTMGLTSGFNMQPDEARQIAAALIAAADALNTEETKSLD